LQGGTLARQEVYSWLDGHDITCDQQGIVIGAGTEHLDTYLPVWHNASHSYSNQHFRQVLDEQAKGIFYGSVSVPTGSPKTEAHQLNRNLLLSQKAQAISRPELDIHTDDVICSHGSTTGQLDSQALYYLQSRGLSTAEATALLRQAFISALVETIDNADMRALIETMLQQPATQEA
jgi:Fe-S cluster assembly protein SufD